MVRVRTKEDIRPHLLYRYGFGTLQVVTVEVNLYCSRKIERASEMAPGKRNAGQPKQSGCRQQRKRAKFLRTKPFRLCETFSPWLT